MNLKQLQCLHKHEQMALDEIDRICRKYELKYYLVGGTLLGAVRHKGFIPWDDDLDVAMPRDDFETFLKVSKSELSTKYFLQTPLTDKGYGYIQAKIRENNTLFVQENLRNVKMHHGIFVDIFPLDYGIKTASRIFLLKKSISDKLSAHLVFRRYKQKKISFKHFIFLWIPDYFVIKIRDLLFHGKGDCYLNYGSQYGLQKQTIEVIHYDPAVRLEFEGKQYFVPKDYDYILRRIYGNDYMKLPPEEKRVTHNPIRLSFDTNGADEVLED